MNALSRRGFLQSIGLGAGAAVGTRLAGPSLEGVAAAQAAMPTTVVFFHMFGGMQAFYGSADALQGKFGVTANNFTKFGAVAIDDTLATAMSPFARQHVAAIGVRHGISAHPSARASLFTDNGKCTPLVFADALGGTSAIKACVLGSALQGATPNPVNGVSLQRINDMKATIEAMGGGTPAANVPDRAGALAGLSLAEKASLPETSASPGNLASLGNGYKTVVDQLKQPVKSFDFAEFSTAYALNNQTVIRTPKSKWAAAELMTRAGANVVCLQDPGWDSHDDVNGANVRAQFTREHQDPMGTFLQRMLNLPDRNVVVVMFGDFSRSLPGSDHQPNLTALVMGRNVKVGTTGRTNANVGLPASCPSIRGFWAYVAAAAKVPGNPFGANPHGLIV